MDPFFEEIRKKERRRRISLIISGLISVIAIGGIFFMDQIESATSGLFNSSSDTYTADEWNTDNVDGADSAPEVNDVQEDSAPVEGDQDLFAENTPDYEDAFEPQSPDFEEESSPVFDEPVQDQESTPVEFDEPVTRGETPSTPVEEVQPVPVSVAEISGEKVFKMADEMPRYPGGLSARKRFFDRNITSDFSSLAANMSQAKVWLQFVVETDGKISSVRVVQGINSKFDQEAIRLASKMPLWEPGRIDGERVRVFYTIPVDFKRS
ncbi:MAG: TonB family protein [Bacteroidota bacterium]